MKSSIFVPRETSPYPDASFFSDSKLLANVEVITVAFEDAIHMIDFRNGGHKVIHLTAPIYSID